MLPAIHLEIFDVALGSNFDDDAKSAVHLGLQTVDVFGQTRPEYHFDSAKNPAEICQRWQDGAGEWLKLMVEYARQAPAQAEVGAEVGLPFSTREQALSMYGGYLHAIQDFYSHSNWVELALQENRLPGVAPITGGCAPAALPANLQTGYFSLWYGPHGCPPAGPPSGFTYCHGPTADPKKEIAKDKPDADHGAEPVQLPDGSWTTYHQVAKALAIEATKQTWPIFHDRIVAEMQEAFPDRDAECLFLWLIQGGDSACTR